MKDSSDYVPLLQPDDSKRRLVDGHHSAPKVRRSSRTPSPKGMLNASPTGGLTVDGKFKRMPKASVSCDVSCNVEPASYDEIPTCSDGLASCCTAQELRPELPQLEVTDSRMMKRGSTTSARTTGLNKKKKVVSQHDKLSSTGTKTPGIAVACPAPAMSDFSPASTSLGSVSEQMHILQLQFSQGPSLKLARYDSAYGAEGCTASENVPSPTTLDDDLEEERKYFKLVYVHGDPTKDATLNMQDNITPEQHTGILEASLLDLLSSPELNLMDWKLEDIPLSHGTSEAMHGHVHLDSSAPSGVLDDPNAEPYLLMPDASFSDDDWFDEMLNGPEDLTCHT